MLRKLIKSKLAPLLFVCILSIHSFVVLFNTAYFTMHDDQHIARLFLLDQGIKQGSLYPRWVDMLGFGFGYPLFNFYPPLIYYVGEAFHLVGFSYMWSIKLMIMTGFIIGAVGMYLFAHKFMRKHAAIVASTLFTYFGYRAVTVYVRGAFAEFFAMSLLPFVFLTFYNVYKKQSLKNSIYFGITLALLVLTHPFIAVPTVLFLGLMFVYYSIALLRHPEAQPKDLVSTDRWDALRFAGFFTLFRMTITGLLIGLGLSAFFWLPSAIERKYTLVDTILLTELANYALHFVYPFQFWYSPWGFGGSIAGPADGVSFALGKIYIGLVVLSIVFFITLSLRGVLRRSNLANQSTHYLLFIFSLVFSLFMSSVYSKPLWDSLSFLHYLQFPWRFLSFTAVFISLVGAFAIEHLQLQDLNLLLRRSIVIVAIIVTLLVQQKYFRPQKFIQTTDQERTSYDEIAWRISRTSFEFAPRGVKTTTSELGTTIIDITQNEIPRSPYEIIAGRANVELIKNNFDKKVFRVKASEPTLFRLNTFNFPGWRAFLTPGVKGVPTPGVSDLSISDDNPYRLITIQVPQGEYEVKFQFINTSIRLTANIISLISLFGIIGYLLRQSVNSNK